MVKWTTDLVWNKPVMGLKRELKSPFIFKIFKGSLSLGEEGSAVQPESCSHLLEPSELNSCGCELCQNQEHFFCPFTLGPGRNGKNERKLKIMYC